jgi:opacity protein-like surface antigen
VLLLAGVTAGAQLTLLPQLGFERSRTSIRYNDAVSFSPLGTVTELNANLRFDYKFKNGFGPYAAIGTSPAIVEFKFTHPASATNDYTAKRPSPLLALQAGYQYTSRPIRLGKSQHTEKLSSKEKSRCSSFGCGSRQKPSRTGAPPQIRLQPSLGMAYRPQIGKGEAGAVAANTTYQYDAGNWKTAVISRVGVELGLGKNRLLNLGIEYRKGISNGGTQTVSGFENGKPVSATFSSKSSAWGVTLGVPFTLTHPKKAPLKRTEQKKSCHHSCDSYRSRCPRRI